MNSCSQRPLWLGAVLAVAVAGPLCAQKQPAKPISFSEPSGSEGTSTNSRSLLQGRNRLEEMESGLNHPLKLFNSGNTLEGLITPESPLLPPAAANPSRYRESQHRRQDWMFLKPEEMYQLKSVEDMYKAPELTPDGRKQSELRPMEKRYMEAMGVIGGGAPTNDAARGIVGYGGSASGMMGSLDRQGGAPGGLSPLEGSLRKAFGMDPESSALRARDSASRFGGGPDGFPAKPTPSQLQRMEEFKQILDFSGTEGGTRAEGGYSTPYVDSSFYDPPKPAMPPPATPTLGGTLSGGTLGSGGSAAWNQQLTPAPPPKPQPPQQPPSPFMPIPRKNF